ncbi:hypothetical protein ABZT49_06120 [Methylobacterium sp. EM32]|uniref:hypothetical protein n=1 Tax=Methylobacterium sp. EM32 TaxID=3163481 RepID=UPI0033AFC213
MLDFLARAAMAGALSSEDRKAPKAKLDADAILARLSLTSRLYAEPCPFRIGDLVTPRADSKAKGAGEPHVVIEVLSGEMFPTGGQWWSPPIVLREPTADVSATSSSQYGQVLDIRVARMSEGAALAYVVESQDFEAWTPGHEEAWRAKLATAAAGPQPLTLAEAVSSLRDRAAGKEVKADWKEGDTVEIVPEPHGAKPPMSVEGVHVGIVQRVDKSDGTTHVLYHAASTGKIGTGWMRNADLKKWGPKAAPEAISA